MCVCCRHGRLSGEKYVRGYISRGMLVLNLYDQYPTKSCSIPSTTYCLVLGVHVSFEQPIKGAGTALLQLSREEAAATAAGDNKVNSPLL